MCHCSCKQRPENDINIVVAVFGLRTLSVHTELWKKPFSSQLIVKSSLGTRVVNIKTGSEVTKCASDHKHDQVSYKAWSGTLTSASLHEQKSLSLTLQHTYSKQTFQGQLRLKCLALGHFNMWSGGAGDWTTDLAISSNGSNWVHPWDDALYIPMGQASHSSQPKDYALCHRVLG